MIRNGRNRPSESTRKLLSDVKQLSWRSSRSNAIGSTSGMEKARSSQSINDTLKKKNSKREEDQSIIILPIEKTHFPQKGSSFFMETVVRRSGNIYTMYLQLPKKTFPLFVGEKHGQTYAFRSILSDNGNGTTVVMGSLCKKPGSNDKKTTLTYALTCHDHYKPPQKVAYMDFEYPTIFQVLTDTKGRPRRCQVKIFGKGAVETKEPNCKEGNQRSLDFRGRGREASRKNMQLQDKDGKVILQMVKWDTDQFHVDFSQPFNAFHAFGFALAQFDI